jgi:hypothetical protein
VRYSSLVVVALAVCTLACDLQPPKRERVPTEPPAPRAADGGGPAWTPPPPTPGTVALASDAGEPPIVASDACLEPAVNMANIVIAATTDPTQRAAMEQDRTRFVRRSAETCTRDGWPETARRCFTIAKSPADLEACGRDLPQK